jgi:hypothetical protein
VPEKWEDAPAPARVAKTAADAIGGGHLVTKEDVPMLTNATHWSYGTAVGAAYTVAARRRRSRPFVRGIGFGAAVWTASYAQLVPLGIYELPWRYPPEEIALDLSYHLVYGAAVAAASARFS